MTWWPATFCSSARTHEAPGTTPPVLAVRTGDGVPHHRFTTLPNPSGVALRVRPDQDCAGS